jgi:hypothetical protein
MQEWIKIHPRGYSARVMVPLDHCLRILDRANERKAQTAAVSVFASAVNVCAAKRRKAQTAAVSMFASAVNVCVAKQRKEQTTAAIV